MPNHNIELAKEKTLICHGMIYHGICKRCRKVLFSTVHYENVTKLKEKYSKRECIAVFDKKLV